MTLDDLDMCLVIYGVSVGAYLEYDIHFALLNDNEAQIP